MKKRKEIKRGILALCIVLSVLVTNTTVVLAKGIYSQFHVEFKVDDTPNQRKMKHISPSLNP